MTPRAVAAKTIRAAGYRLPLSTKRRLLYFRRHRRLPSVRSPQTFTEKVNARILFDRRVDVLRPTCDKLEMKQLAQQSSRVGVPRTLWVGTDVRELAEIELPEQWVLKPNHRSGLVYFGSGRVSDPGVLASYVAANGWLDSAQWERYGEWAYTLATPTLLAESAIGQPGIAPEDYKFFVFRGVPRLVQVDTGRFDDHRRRLYRPDWTPLPHRNLYPVGPVLPAPPHLPEMLEIAGDIGRAFDFIRVDLYDVPDGVYFGEITPYPGGGLEPYEPRDLDVELGSYWTWPS